MSQEQPMTDEEAAEFYADPANREPQGPPVRRSAPTDRTETAREIGNVIYAWQMRVDDGWNIIGAMVAPGHTLPLVTTSMAVAWEAFEVAQAHANRGQCQVRLAAFKFDTLAAVVEPND